MHTLDAQDDVSVLCQAAQLEPLAYIRFDLPVMAVSAPLEQIPQQSKQTIEPEKPRPGIASGPQGASRAAPDPAPPRAETPVQEEAGDSAERDPHAVSAAEAAKKNGTAPSGPERLPIVLRSVENGLSALASVHDHVTQVPTVLPLASAVGGGGSTTVLGGLGRALSILGERVLLVDANAPSTLDYCYRSHSAESNLLLSSRSCSPFEGQLHVLRTDHDGRSYQQSCSTRMHRAVAELRGRLDRIVIAGREALTPAIAQQARAGGVCLVLVTPEVRCLMALPAILRSLREPASGPAAAIRPVFLLNRFDQSDPAHREVHGMLAEELGTQLLPFWIPESPTVSQSLVQRVNPLDLAPQSSFAEACFNLAEWYRSALESRESLPSQSEENQLVSE